MDYFSGCGETLRFGEHFNRHVSTDGQSVRGLHIATMKTKRRDLTTNFDRRILCTRFPRRQIKFNFVM